MKTVIRRVYYHDSSSSDESYTESWPLSAPALDIPHDAYGVYKENEDGTQNWLEDFNTLDAARSFVDSLPTL